MIVEQFAGPGGWSTGARLLGLGPSIGYEWDKHAVRTARAAGHQRVQIDVSHVPWAELAAFAPECEGHITSPPCQAYSAAGSQLGLQDVARIAAHLAQVAERGEWLDYRDRDEAVVDLWGEPAVDHSTWADPRSALVLEAVRWQLALQPEWVAAEQVPQVLPLWQQWGEFLTSQGYSVWTGVLGSEQYGVPQTRKRAILLASRRRAMHAPVPTHRRYHPKTMYVPGDEYLPSWVSMAQALGVEPGVVGFPRASEYDSRGVKRGSDFRATDEPSFALTEKARSWSRSLNEVEWLLRPSFSDAGSGKPVPRPTEQPAPTITTKGGNYDWVHERPATTVQGDARVWPPGHKVNADDRRRLGDEADERYGDRAGSEAVKVSVPEAACLQSFPVGYPWDGSDTVRYRQVGDAVPPLLAAAVLGVATGREAEAQQVCRAAYAQEPIAQV